MAPKLSLQGKLGIPMKSSLLSEGRLPGLRSKSECWNVDKTSGGISSFFSDRICLPITQLVGGCGWFVQFDRGTLSWWDLHNKRGQPATSRNAVICALVRLNETIWAHLSCWLLTDATLALYAKIQLLYRISLFSDTHSLTMNQYKGCIATGAENSNQSYITATKAHAFMREK